MARVDVVVLGGGPGGVSCAVALARRGLSVHLVDRPRTRRRRPVETLSPSAVRAFNRLRLGGASEQIARHPCRGILYRWQSEEPELADHALVGCGPGAVLERDSLDATLREDATSAGVQLWSDAEVTRCQSSNDGLALLVNSRAAAQCVHLEVSFAVDASGRSGGFPTPELRPSRRYQDRLVALAFDLPDRSEGDMLQVAAAADGWWYSAPRSDGGASVVFLTDVDLLPSIRDERCSFLRSQWRSAFGRELQPSNDLSAGTMFDARTSVRSAFFQKRWLAVGDAAFTVDPLSGNGVERALRLAEQAADGVVASLRHHDQSPLLALADAQGRAFANERDAGLRTYARAASRFGASRFWQRRSPLVVMRPLGAE